MQIIEQLARDIGFHLIHFTSATLDSPSFKHYQNWVTAGRAGEMAYMAREPKRRRSIEALLPHAKSVICLGVNYYRSERERPADAFLNRSALIASPTGQIARYAYGRDYHKIITKMLKRLATALREQYPDHEWKSYVDTGAVLERGYAAQSGMGYIGKNTNLITPSFGSWVFLAEVLTTMDLKNPDLDPRSESSASCGHCRLCLDICPTGALVSAYELDARKCISYLTIENRGPIPLELRPLIGDWLYGCDLCQEVCPKNSVNQDYPLDSLTAVKIGGDFQLLEEILQIRTTETFDKRFAGSAMRRAKREGLVRNACVVAANIKAISLLPILKKVAHIDSSAIVREHASWAIQQFES